MQWLVVYRFLALSMHDARGVWRVGAHTPEMGNKNKKMASEMQ